MANPVKQAIIGAIQDSNEALVKPIRDEVGQALEQGIKTVIAGPPNAQQQQVSQQQKMQNEAKRQTDLTEARRKVAFWTRIDQEQKAVRQKQTQEQAQKNQVKHEETKIKQVEVMKKQEKKNIAKDAAIKTSQAELKAGKGIGG